MLLCSVRACRYLQAYLDLAQIATKCATMNTAVDDSDGSLRTAFKVDYGTLAFTITAQYAPHDQVNVAYYIKTATMPGTELLTLPTVVVDVQNSTDPSFGYDNAILYSCNSILGLPVKELIFITRAREVDKATLAALEQRARDAGVVWDADLLKHQDWSECK